jgi:hypothetical protein
MNTLLLALRGGGCLDYGQAVFLGMMEQRYGDLTKVVGGLAGTSAGCINGLYLGAGKPMAELAKFYTDLAPNICHSSMFSAIGMIAGAKYNPAARQGGLQSVFEDMTLADLKLPCCFTAHDKATGQNVFFQNYGTAREDENEVIITDPTVKLWEIAMASSAAPTYFPGFEWRGRVLFDGGLTTLNAPDAMLFDDFYNLLGVRNLKMLSLGNGRVRWQISADPDPGAINAIHYFIEAVLRGAETTSIYEVKREMGNNHFLVNPDLGDGFAIDDTRAGTLAALSAAWASAFGGAVPVLDQVDCGGGRV